MAYYYTFEVNTAVMRFVAFLFICTLLQYTNVAAQPVCGFDELNQLFLHTNSYYRSKSIVNEQLIANLIKKRKFGNISQMRETTVFTIPVVVHVLHTGDTIGSVYNPPDEQIQGAINYLNAVYNGTDPSLTPEGTDAAGDLGLRFVLAKRDPDCNPVNGIDRVDMSSNADYVLNGATNLDMDKDIALKTPVMWDKTQYYNIYVVNKINGKDGTSGQFIAGYAYFPNSSNADGAVMLASQMKAGSKTLPHEIGHAFNLYHPFEGSYNRTKCPVGNGDYVADTDPISFNAGTTGVVNFTCRTGNNTCINQPYNIRTESNFMNYTNCFTLFTPGQKDRVQAAVLLEDRASLITSAAATPTYESPVCAAKINFDKKNVIVTRSGLLIDGCRKYKDYTFNFTIGNDPTQPASAVISIDPGSTAVEGADFNFPEGRNVLFPSGTHSNQPFTLRIYSNGSVSNEKSIRLNFSVNSHGGNAVKGSLCTEMNFTIKPLDFSPVEPGTAGVKDIGDFTYQINNAKMFNASIRKQRTQIIYKAQELLTAGIPSGSISGVQFFLEKKSTRSFKNLSIRMAQTTIAGLVQDGEFSTVSNMITVLFLSSYTTVDGWNTFTLPSPFEWNGVNNLAIELCFDNETAISDNQDIIHAYSDGGVGMQGNMIENEGINCGENFSAASYYQNGVKPIIRLNYIRAGNPVVNSITTSRKEYLGPYSEVYFYEASTPARIIARIKNLSGWNYGCTEVKVDRIGNSTSPFWNNNFSQFLTKKSFFVTPEHNNPAGSYEITLYYSNAEKSGYESTTGNAWADVKIIKSEMPIESITPTDPHMEKVEINNMVDHGIFGDNYTVGAVFNTGFSGFATGSVEAVLPVSWLSFDGIPTKNGVQLQWVTAQEFNNNYFEVESGTDGTIFNVIGKLRSKGNSSLPVSYDFIHQQPHPGKNYYRIKQVDFDGVSTYSKTIMVEVKNTEEIKPWISPVPAGNNITVHFGKPLVNAMIEILSIDMQKVYAEKINGTILNKDINAFNWIPGTYIARITTAKNSYVIRFVKY